MQYPRKDKPEMEHAPTLTASTAPAQPPPLSAELQRRFIAYIDARPQSLAAYGKGIKRLFQWLEAEDIPHPRREDILEYREYLKAEYAPATVSLYMTAARLFFRWTAQEGFYPDIAERIKGAKIDRGHRKGYFTSQAVKSIISTADRDTATGKRDFALIALMATGGLRCIEIARANIEDLTTQGDSTILFIQGKGKDERTDWIKIPEQTETAIRDYLATRPNTTPKDPLFTCGGNRHSEQGRLTTRSISRICKTHFRAAGYNDSRLTAHSLRHTAATLAILAGATLIETQEHLRHASPTTTMIYINETNKSKNPCAQQIASAIF